MNITNEQLTVPSVRSVPDGLNSGRSKPKETSLGRLVQEQVEMIKQSQEQLLNLVDSIDLSENEVNLDTVESIRDIVMKSEDLIVMVQVIIKVRNELGHARLDHEKAKKAKKMVTEGERRVQWLEDRLENLLIECHTKSSHLLKSATGGFTQGVSLAGTYLSSSLGNELTPSQCERIFCDVGGYTRSEEEETKRQKHYNMAVGVMEISQKMISRDDESDNHLVSKDESSTSIQSHGLDDTGEMKPLEDPPTDNNQPQTEILSKTEETNEEYPVSPSPRFSSREASPCEQPSRFDLESHPSLEDSSDDEVEKYWRSDHHKFEWPDASIQQRAPLSWHSLGLPIQDSFISKERPLFTPDLPWKERATHVNSVLDIHKLALDKLYTKLHLLYDAIEKATEASINPIPKNDKIETRMGNIESTPSSTVPKAISRSSPGGDMKEEETDERSFPTLGTKNVSFFSTPDCKTDITPFMLKNPGLTYPRHSSVWCSSQKYAGRVVKKITTKTPVKQNRTQAILSKKMLEHAKRSETRLEKHEAMVWRPSIVYKMVKATRVLKLFQVQIQHRKAVRRSGPKWKRVQWLLGPSGLESPTRAVVIRSLKSLSELRCSDTEVGTALMSVVRKSQDPRVLYEASKALILSGHWHHSALDVLLNALLYGAVSLKKEILDALTSLDEIPCFDKNTQSFQQLRSALEELVKGNDPVLAFSSALCLGKLSVVAPITKNYLTEVLKTHSFTSKQRGQALNVLVRQMNCKDDDIVNALLHELNTSINWKVRVQAGNLLMYVGAPHVLRRNPDDIFVVLDRLLWDHAQQEVRSKVAELLNALRLRKKACSLVLKRLEDPEETVRARAIISLATLEMKEGKEMKALLDILVLDSSVYARVQAVRAFSKLRWNDPRVLRSLREREKGEGILAREARKAINQITKKS